MVRINTKIKNTVKFQENILIRLAETTDISSFVALSYKKRRAYEKVQPQFRKYAGPEAEKSQKQWFEELLRLDDHIMLAAVYKEKILGFIIGRLMSAPKVYNPGGLTLMIDDFCVESKHDWNSIGQKLIKEIKKLAKTKNATQFLVVCGAYDEPKRNFLKSMGLTVASEWYVGRIM